MFTAARPSRLITIATDNFATHFYLPFVSLTFGTLTDQTPKVAIGTAANKQSQP